ncbi:MAG: uroporphyrinogen decarboxylase family protein [Anaerolineae bacterium]
MSARERVVRAMNFEATDRLPIMMNWLTVRYVLGLTGMSEDQYWADQIGAHARAFKILGIDFCEQLAFPPREETHRSWSRSELERWSNAEAVAADLEQRCAQIEVELSGLEAQREEQVQAICAYQIETQRQLGEDCLWIFGMDPHGPAIIHFPYGIYGYEGFFLCTAAYPEVMERYWRLSALRACWHNECVVEAARRLQWPRIGYLGDDVTTERGNMISPRLMSQRFFPHLEYALQPLVASGFKLVWHSDGNMNDMLQPLIDIGISGFQGFQEECGTRIRDVARLRARNGDPLILWGSVSAIDVVRNGTFDDIRQEVERVLTEWPHPGLCLGTASAMMDDVPHANITELYRLFRTLGAQQRSLRRP